MATFKVFQIQLTDSEIDQINAAGDHFAVPKNKVRMGLQFNDEPQELVNEGFEKGYFDHVSNIIADSLEGVFHVGNVGPEASIERLAPMHSVSVGDVIEDENGDRHMVASFGFTQV